MRTLGRTLMLLGIGAVTLGIVRGHLAQANRRAPETPVIATAAQNTPDANAPDAPDFPATLSWLNTDKPLSLKDLRGKVVLLDFWTYCCINCIHIIPDLKRLEAKYPNELVVVGVHSAKFQNEKDAENIRNAILRYEIEHPVINDRDFLIWNTYGVRSWPTLVLIAPDGKVVGGVSGEGHYEVLDRAIASLIRDYDARKLLDRKPMRFVLEKENKPKSVLSYPGKIVSDAGSKRLFFTDSNHNRVLVASLDGEVQEVIGDGNVGLKDGGFSEARFFRPQGLCFDAAQNVLYVADTENHALRRVDLEKRTVLTIAGNGKQGPWPLRSGVGRKVQLSSPWDVLQKGNTLYIAMAGTHQLWTLNLKTLEAAPHAGGNKEDILDGPLLDAHLAQPSGLTTDGKRLYFADSEVSAVRAADFERGGRVQTIIGKGLFDFGDVDGEYSQARLQHAIGVAYHDGYIYIADTYNHKVKRISPNARRLETFIGTGQRGMEDGPAKEASLNEPNGLTFVGDKLYIADTNNHLIRVYDPADGKLATLKLSGLEKLTRKSNPSFGGKELLLAAQEVSPSATALEITVKLPKGTKFNLAAPFQIAAVSDKPEAVTVGPLNLKEPADTLTIPITPKTGEAIITVDLAINYCAVGNEGLCYFKETRLKIPLKVTPNGAANATVRYTL